MAAKITPLSADNCCLVKILALKKIQIETHECERFILAALLPAVLINTLTKGTRGLI